MTRAEFVAWARQRPNLKEDRYGNFFVLNLPDGTAPIRYKPKHLAVRKERQITVGQYRITPADRREDGKEIEPVSVRHEWVRIRSGYYKDLSINTEGKLEGMK